MDVAGMKGGKCPECGSTSIHYDSIANRKAPAWATTNRGWINISGRTKHTKLDTYVCTTCGYVRSFIADSQQLERIAEHWPKVGEPSGREG